MRILKSSIWLLAVVLWQGVVDPAHAKGIDLQQVMIPCCEKLPDTKRSPALFLLETPQQKKQARSETPTMRRSRSRLLLSSVLTIGAGALAYWSKERADKAYSRYLRSANVERQQRQFDRAERFDRVSGAAFVSMEIGLIYTSYLLFFRR